MPGQRKVTESTATLRRRRLATCTLVLAHIVALAIPCIAAAECSLNVVDVSFGSYDTFALAHTDITGTVSVSCDTETSLQVSLSAGLGTFATRHMTNGPSNLLYNLYMDASRVSIWGDGSPGTSLLSLSGTGGSYTVYGRILAHQNVSVGVYGDTVTVSVIF
jgi:spore coat protein U-like protein